MDTLSIISLPEEVLGNILAFLTAPDIVCFGKTCRRASNFTSPSNQLLWRDAFLHVFDDPEEAWASHAKSFQPGRNDWDWHQQLVARSQAVSTYLPFDFTLRAQSC